MDRRCNGQGSVRDPAGDDDGDALTERLANRLRAQVGVGTDHAPANRRECCSRFQVDEAVPFTQESIEARTEIVAGYRCNGSLFQTGLVENGSRSGSAGSG